MNSKRPSFVFLCADEMKATALGCYGQPLAVSPFLDDLATRSVVFEQHHVVHTKCVPSRVAMVTGQYPHVGGHRTLQLYARPEEPNMVRQLRQAGYQTVLVGRNHMLDAATMRETFDVWIESPERRTLEPAAATDIPGGAYPAGPDPLPLEKFLDHDVTSRALRWLLGERDSSRPFVLWVNWDCPHPPYGAPAPYYGRLDRKNVALPPKDHGRDKPAFFAALHEAYGTSGISEPMWQELIATYLEMTTLIDDQVRRIHDALETLALVQDTVTVFTADHGDFAGEHQLPEKWDTAFFDCLTRVPLIISAPGRLGAQRLPHLVENIDVWPTLLEMADVALPAGVQGRSCLPICHDPRRVHRRRVFCQGGQEAALLERVVPDNARPRPCRAYQMKQAALHRNPHINSRAKSVRDERFRYNFRLGDVDELYDLTADPWELVNLAGLPDFVQTRERYRRLLIETLIEAETAWPDQDFLES